MSEGPTFSIGSGSGLSIGIVGGGIIGLACAWRLAQQGWQVTVFDSAPEAREASWAAAGMLAPHHEADALDERWRLGLDSLARWPAFADELGGAGELHTRFDGGLLPIRSDVERTAIDARVARLQTVGVDARWFDRTALAAQAPALAHDVIGAWWLPGGQVNPRLVTARLRSACATLGVDLRYHCTITAIAAGCIEYAEKTQHFTEVVIASGAWTPTLARTSGLALIGEPVKGQLLRLDAPDGLLAQFVHTHGAYVVPRAGQGVVVGATMVAAGFDRSDDPAAIATLAADARRLVPSLKDAAIVETWTGLRPRLHGDRPLIARITPGLIIATGHFRNGILLTPITADAVAALVANSTDTDAGTLPASVKPFAELPFSFRAHAPEPGLGRSHFQP